MPPRPTIRAWRPPVAGVAEVLHAYFPDHAYPSHTHDTWTLLLVDTGTIRYDLDHHEHGALGDRVTLLPPHVPHDGRTVEATGFRKRVVYLDADVIGVDRIGAAVDHPGWVEPALRGARSARCSTRSTTRATRSRARSGWPWWPTGCGSRLAGATEPPSYDATCRWRTGSATCSTPGVVEGLSLPEAAAALGAHPTHLVRAFSREFGIPPHRYLTGRRLDRARRLLLAGERAADVAVAVGFHDQAHLTRHFRRLLGVAPAAYARSAQ